MSVHDPKQCPIAIVGVSAIFPGSVDATGFWHDIFTGKDLLGDVPDSHWLIEDYYDPDPSAPDKTYGKRGGFLSDIEFDPLEWGVPPSIVPATDTTQLLALITAKKVLEDACGDGLADLDKDKVSCILGVTGAQELMLTMANRLQRPVWVKALRELGYDEEEVQIAADKIAGEYVPWQESTFPGLLGNVVAGRIANRLDIGGTNCVTDAACASSFSAVSMGANELWLGQSDLVITGGADTMNDISMYMCFSKTPALSKTGECAPFSDRADGTLLGEGLGMVALKRLPDAVRDGDKIYAVIKGIGSSSDGRSKSVYAPVSNGQAKAIRRAYAQAGYDADTVELVEAHGTGTKAGDAAEFEGLRMAFGASGRTDAQWCALGTVKSQIGHTKAAAGAAGLFKVVMALHNRVLPPTLKIERPNPKLDLENSPFYLSTSSRPWVRPSTHPRRGAISSFGFGGSNFHITVEEYTGPERAPRLRVMPSELVVLAAASPQALISDARAMAAKATHPDFLAYAAYQSQQTFDATKPARMAIVAKSSEELAQRLHRIADKIAEKPQKPIEIPTGMYYHHGSQPGPLAFVFPGQGSQYINMGADLAMAFDAMADGLDAASDLDLADRPIHEVIFPIPAWDTAGTKALEDTLRATEWAQPAIGTVSLAMLRLVRELGLEPTTVGGHSYGEVTALGAAGALSEADVLRVARKRGELMAEAAQTDGAMIAVPLPIEQVRPYVDAVPNAVVANHNAPKQVVVSGPTQAVDQVEKALLDAGIEPKRLKVATAFHSPVVSASVEPFSQFLQTVDVQVSRIPVLHNAEAAPYPAAPGAIRERLGTAIAKPVRFVEQIEAMYASGVRTFVEVGPGHVLTNLIGEILGDRPHLAVPLDRRKKNTVTTFFQALARLSVAGHALAFSTLWKGQRIPDDPHDRRKPKLSLKLNGANFDKPYPPKGGADALPKPNPVRTGPAKAREPEPQVVEKVVERRVEVPVATPGAAPMPAASTAGGSDPWILAFQHAQRSTVEAHQAYQRAMAETHDQFLRTVEASLQNLQGLLTGTPGPAPTFEAPTFQAPTLPPVVAAPPVQPTPAPVAPPAAPPAPAPAPTPAPAAPSLDLEQLLLNVVADKTGYPADMLEMEMTLEADLGIDSIKRVEILSAVREAAPGLPEVDTAAMAQLQTLGEVRDHLREHLPASPAGTAAPRPAAAAPPAGVDIEGLLLNVVADKTGYPADMLEMGMALEADLGIDSIKRVEILSAVREAAPDLPEVDTAAMAQLQTLGEVRDYLRANLPAGGAAPVVASPSAPATAAPARDLEGLLLNVVSDKTGYPADMLEMSMALEADLGIDSIKRVEILSAVRDAAPELPEVDTAAMAQLQTLGEVRDYLRANLPGNAPAAPAPTATPAAPAPAAGLDLNALLLEVVADKTGYPADMLEMSMALEADLGIDSIKRVEILSAVREKAPGLPEVDTAAMAKLETLGQVVDHLQGFTDTPAATPAPTAAPAPPTPALGRWRLDAVEAAPIGLTTPGLRPGATIEVMPRSDQANAVVAAFAREGLAASAVDAPGADVDVLIYVGGWQPSDPFAAQRQGFAAARTVAQRFGAPDAHEPLFVTVQDTGGDFGLSGSEHAWSAGLTGLVKTAVQEWPKTFGKALDIPVSGRGLDQAAEAVVHELLAGGPDLEVGRPLDGRRLVLRSVADDAAPAPAARRDQSVIVASGGAKGVTAHTLIALARAQGGRFVLLGRTALEDEPGFLRGLTDEPALKKALLDDARSRNERPTPAELGRKVGKWLGIRQIRDTMARIEAAGGQARYAAVDVTDAHALGALLDDVRGSWGAVTGLVHGAGVLADKRIADKTMEQFDRVFDTKVRGLQALLAATANDPLDTLLFFSSVAGRCGNQGQADYAMANEVLAKVAAYEQTRRGDGVVVRALQWGPWEGGMVTPQLKAHFEAQGVPLIGLDAGAAMLVAEVTDHRRQTEVVLGGEPRMAPLADPGADGSEVLRLRLRAHRRTHPYLADHQVRDTPVVPVVLVLEWFARAGQVFRSHLALQSFRDVKVTRGISLTGFDNGGDWFDVTVREESNGTGSVLAVELTDLAGTTHYVALADMVPELAPAPPSPDTPRFDPVSDQTIYDGTILFHGQTFQVIDALEGASDEGIVARLTRNAEAAWGHEPWQTDPAALDGGLQLALLYSARMLGGASLPMGVETMRTFRSGPPDGPLRAVLRGETRGRDKTITDIVFTDEVGNVVHELRGVQAIRLP
ncbi:MAG: SDR family NAD(P)-dependent oxidoreductase [Myxococcota bacterium]